MKRHAWARRAIRSFESDHQVQLRFHLVAMLFWIVNAVAGTVVMVLWPDLWLRIGVYYVFLLSIYANWDTDYDAVSASQAALHAQALLDQQPPSGAPAAIREAP